MRPAGRRLDIPGLEPFTVYKHLKQNHEKTVRYSREKFSLKAKFVCESESSIRLINLIINVHAIVHY